MLSFWLLWVCVAVSLGALFAGLAWIYREAQAARAEQRNGVHVADAQVATPWLIKFAAPLLAWFGVRLKPIVSLSMHEKMGKRLVLAGLDTAIATNTFVATKALISASTFMLCGLWLLLGFDELVQVTRLQSFVMAAAIVAAWYLPDVWLSDVVLRRQRSIFKALPFYIDLLKISIEAGSNLQGALRYAVGFGPPGPLRQELARVLGDMKSGRTRADAMQLMAKRLDLMPINHLAAAISAAERQGGSLVGILQAQAEQRRTERFASAETAAMKAPVKLIFPLVVFIFPGTFIVLFFPIAVRLMQEGLL